MAEVKGDKKIKFVEISSMAELNNDDDNVFLKITKNGCPPCRSLNKYLDTLTLNKQITIFCINISSGVSNDVKEFINNNSIKSVPFLGFIEITKNKEYKVINQIRGFYDSNGNQKKEETLAFIERYE
ncbi:hypothetical protein A0H76_1386 [Hepatospora eriocheir]|uniref:Thioredoxin domain-containing protein n=1 Tax=Hepatospora eriocheir TaxID=1081669 RepID=A0A1X0QH49_9MICR|nr:hypothetical protein A0H76_1386 [Hepatospora eriocheir]